MFLEDESHDTHRATLSGYTPTQEMNTLEEDLMNTTRGRSSFTTKFKDMTLWQTMLLELH